jgi:hypothetical protein
MTARKETLTARLERIYKRAHEKGHGLTVDEATRIGGYTAADGVWKRVSDLLRAGRVRDTGQTRPGTSGRPQRVLRWVPPALNDSNKLRVE